MDFILNNSISILIIVFFILYAFVGFLRKPLTTVMFFFVMNNALPQLVSSLAGNTLVVLIISAVATAIFTVLALKYRKFSGFFFGFTITYLVFFQFAATVDAVLFYAKKENIDFLSKVLNGKFIEGLDSAIFQVGASATVGLVCFAFNKKFVEFLAGLFGGYMIVIFLLDAANEGTVSKFPISTFFKDIAGVVTQFIDKNTDVYSIALNGGSHLTAIIALVLAVIIACIVAAVKKDKYKFLYETNC